MSTPNAFIDAKRMTRYVYCMTTLEKSLIWYNRVRGSMTANAVASASNVIQSTLSRQIKSGSLSVDTVIAVARGLNLNPVAALVESGYLTQEEVAANVYLSPLSEVSDQELCAEVLRRISLRDDEDELADTNVEEEAHEDTPAPPTSSEWDLAARHKKRRIEYEAAHQWDDVGEESQVPPDWDE